LIPYPVPEFNYDVPFEVVGDPYDYGLEGANYTQLAPTPAVGD
jgi:cytochrome c oxidase subunit 1